MIRWCCYCQRFLGEIAPFETPLLTHCICPSCDAKLERDDDLVAKTAEVRDLMNRVFDAAARADAGSIPPLITEAVKRSLPASSMLVGLIQPALYRAGEEWSEGRMSVAAEHQLTSWCERFFALMPTHPPSGASLDLLLFLGPGNAHTLGPRFIAELLNERGVSTLAIVPELPIEEMVAQIERHRPRAVGFSCALPSSLPAADALCAELATRVDPSWPRRFFLGGYALRSDTPWRSSSGASVLVTLEEVEALLRAPYPILSAM